jgi:hypothetical protein
MPDGLKISQQPVASATNSSDNVVVNVWDGSKFTTKRISFSDFCKTVLSKSTGNVLYWDDSNGVFVSAGKTFYSSYGNFVTGSGWRFMSGSPMEAINGDSQITWPARSVGLAASATNTLRITDGGSGVGNFVAADGTFENLNVAHFLTVGENLGAQNILYGAASYGVMSSWAANFDEHGWQEVSVSGSFTLGVLNPAAGKSVTVLLKNVGTGEATLSFDAGIVFMSPKPTTLVAGKIGLITFACCTDGTVLASYAVSQ